MRQLYPYEQAINDLKYAIASIPATALTISFDPQTVDDNCKSIESILMHAIYTGFGYATSIHNLKGNQIQGPTRFFI